MRFGSLLVYSPRGKAEASLKSRQWCYAIKEGNPKALKAVADRLALTQRRSEPLAVLFEGFPLLVPIPRSAPLVAGALWPAEAICKALLDAGVARHMEPLLERAVAVPRSSSAAPGARPGIQTHFDSLLERQSLMVLSGGILLVDDVVTKGTTAVAAARRLRQLYPDSVSISLFAAVRTMGLIPDINQILEPVVGTIRAIGDEGDRQP